MSLGNLLKKAAAPRYGLQPEQLMQAGILSDPETLTGAYRKARGLIRQGAFADARALLEPHARTDDAAYQPRVAELLGVCATHGFGHWRPLMQSALEGYLEQGAISDAARVRRHMGDQHLRAGDFSDADRCFGAAASDYQSQGDLARAAMCRGRRARVSLRAGYVKKALVQIDTALQELLDHRVQRGEAMARLDRARILAHLGERSGCARELMAAERLLAPSASLADRMQTRLTHAETLLIMGEHSRAATGLRNLMKDVVELEDVEVRAWVYRMLGESLAASSPAEARRHLTRSKHLHDRLDAGLGSASCELALVAVERELGLNPIGRLKRLGMLPTGEWAEFGARLRIARAEAIAETSPDLARRLLFEARSFGLKSGQRSMVTQVDTILGLQGTPVQDLPTSGPEIAPVVLTGVRHTMHHVANPSRIDEFDSAPGVDKRESPRRDRAVRLVDSTAVSGLTLPRPPRGTGVRRAPVALSGRGSDSPLM